MTTIGSVLGPNLVGPSEPVARAMDLPVLVGPYLFSVVGLALATLVMLLFLRPDPLLEARRRSLAGDAQVGPRGSVLEGLRILRRSRVRLVTLLTLAVGHAVMVSVMVMTPLHMRHGHAELTVIGLVISLHIVGMFAFSPITGWCVDRFGARWVALAGALTLVVATLLASSSPMGSSSRLTLGLFLLGLGWSGTYVSASSALAATLTLPERASGQGAADMIMSLVAAGAGAIAGVVVDHAGFHWLALTSMAFALVVALAAISTPGLDTRAPRPNRSSC